MGESFLRRHQRKLVAGAAALGVWQAMDQEPQPKNRPPVDPAHETDSTNNAGEPFVRRVEESAGQNLESPFQSFADLGLTPQTVFADFSHDDPTSETDKGVSAQMALAEHAAATKRYHELIQDLEFEISGNDIRVFLQGERSEQDDFDVLIRVGEVSNPMRRGQATTFVESSGSMLWRQGDNGVETLTNDLCFRKVQRHLQGKLWAYATQQVFRQTNQ